MDAIVLAHDGIPTATVSCTVEAVPEFTEQAFLDAPVLSDVVVLALTPAGAQPLLEHYRTYKSQRPEIAALFLLPNEPDPAWQPLLKAIIKVDTISARTLGVSLTGEAAAKAPRLYGIWYDAPQTRPGVLKADALPAAVKLLHVRLTPKLTLVCSVAKWLVCLRLCCGILAPLCRS